MTVNRPMQSQEVNDCRPPSAEAATERIWFARTGHLRACMIPAKCGGATIRLAGDLDMASAPLINEALQMVPLARSRQIRLDLSAVSFCDCAGLNALIAGDRSLRAAGGRLTLVDPSAPTRRLLLLTGLDRVLAPDAG
jgi:anti-sigma B factor antagonist